jgi:hypothetical protein
MQLTELFVNFLINLVAGIAGILIVLWIERQRRPSLSMRVGEPGRIVDGDPLKRPPCTWPHIQVHNRNVPFWLAWVYHGEPALSCRAWITFHDLDGHRVFDREMNVRWSETPEPKLRVINIEGVQAAQLEGVQDAVDIPPGEYNNVDVVFRAKGEDACYGWNSESYIHNWHHPSWQLERGRYIAKIRVKTGGREFSDAFLIVNDEPYENFRLEPIDHEIKKRLR